MAVERKPAPRKTRGRGGLVLTGHPADKPGPPPQARTAEWAFFQACASS